jgi:hypothetical protein
VLKELNMGAVPSAMAVSDRALDFDSYVPGADSLGDPFAATKTASEYPSSNPLGELWDARDRLNGLREHFHSEHTGVMVRYDDAAAEMCKQARQVLLGGGTTSDISRAVASLSENPDMTKLALRLIESAVGDVPRSITKTASVNRSHPLAASFCAFQKVAMDRFRLAAAIDDVESRLNVVRSTIKARLG